MTKRARGWRYLIGAFALAVVLAIVQVGMPLALTAAPSPGAPYHILTLIMFWLGIPGIAGLLTAGLILIELGKDDSE